MSLPACPCRGCRAEDYAAEYRRRLTLCGLATCEAPGAKGHTLCEQHLAEFRAWAAERCLTEYGAQLAWMQARGGGWWDPRPAP